MELAFVIFGIISTIVIVSLMDENKALRKKALEDKESYKKLYDFENFYDALSGDNETLIEDKIQALSGKYGRQTIELWCAARNEILIAIGSSYCPAMPKRGKL